MLIASTLYHEYTSLLDRSFRLLHASPNLFSTDYFFNSSHILLRYIVEDMQSKMCWVGLNVFICIEILQINYFVVVFVVELADHLG